MFCKNCGKEIASESRFCTFCGSNLSDVSHKGVSQPEVAAIKYAGFWIRFAAHFIDNIIAVILAAIGAGILTALGSESLGLLAYYVIFFGYFIVLTYNKGATWGKMAVGVRVVTENREKLNIGKVILRETIGKIISGIILGVGYMMAGFTEKKQALHDKMADTYVVYDKPEEKNNNWIIFIIAIPLFISIIGILAGIILVSVSSARQKAVVASFKSEVLSIVPSMLIACDENSISVKDLGSPKYFDPNMAVRTLTQDCGPKSSGSFSITVDGINNVSSESAVCTQNGCTFK